MTTFNHEEGCKNLDYALLRDSSVNMYHKSSILEADIDWLNKHDYEIITFDCSKWSTEEQFYEEFSKAMSFPEDYPAHNLDGLNDWMYDIQFLGSGKVLVFKNFDLILNGEMLRLALHLLDILEKHSRNNILIGRRLMTLLQSNNPNINIQGFGETFAQWNQKEWSYKDRGAISGHIQNFEYTSDL